MLSVAGGGQAAWEGAALRGGAGPTSGAQGEPAGGTAAARDEVAGAAGTFAAKSGGTDSLPGARGALAASAAAGWETADGAAPLPAAAGTLTARRMLVRAAASGLAGGRVVHPGAVPATTVRLPASVSAGTGRAAAGEREGFLRTLRVGVAH